MCEQFYLPCLAMIAGMYSYGGMHAVFWGFYASTWWLSHGVFLVNSAAHKVGGCVAVYVAIIVAVCVTVSVSVTVSVCVCVCVVLVLVLG